MKIKLLVSVWMLLCLPVISAIAGATAAPAGVVSGTVFDKDKQPLPGVSVVVKNTTLATLTDINGRFQLSASVNDVLVFSFIGFATAEYTVTSEDQVFEIVLLENVKQLEEVVVVGYGTVLKKDMTGAAQNLTSDVLQRAMAINPAEALNGRASGVEVRKSTNRPGADVSIQIRGVNSFNYSNEPLYVINGVPSSAGMKYINPEDIESIDILKDASSCAIYGSRGANGVIIITTKGATKKEGFEVSYNGYTGVKAATRIPAMIGNMGNGSEYLDYRTNLWTKKYGKSSLMREDFLTRNEKQRIKNSEYYDWIREVAHLGWTNNHSLSVSGGANHTSYTFGVGYMNDEGLVGNENYERLTANLGLEYSSKYFKSGISMYASLNNINEGANDALLNAYFIPPIVSPYDTDGSYLFKCQPTSSKVNPFIDIENTKRLRDQKFTTVSGYVEALPLEGLSVKSQLSAQYDYEQYGEYFGTYTQAREGVNMPLAYQSTGSNLNWVWDNILTYKATFAERHKIHFIGLFSTQKDTHKSNAMRGDGLPYESDWYAIQTADEIIDVESDYWESAMVSLMGRLNYTFDDKYLLTVTARYDGSSRLHASHRWGLMPSVALAWQAKNEAFLQDVSWLNQLKFRLSWGKTGNNSVPYDVSLTKLEQIRYNYGDNGVNGFGIGSSKGNADLRWEMTSEWNFGVDFGFFGNRLTGTVDVYERITKDLIFARSVPNLNGFSSILENIGSTGNRGVELELHSFNIDNKNFQWRTDFTFSLNRNRIIDLYGDKQDDLANRWFIGQPISVIYDFNFLGIWQQEEAAEAEKYGQVPGHIKVEDSTPDYSLNEKDYKILGTPNPDWTAGLTNTFTYKNLDLSVSMYMRFGGLYDDEFTYMFTGWDNEHWNKLDVEYWTPENRSNKYPQVGAISLYTQVLSKVSGTFLKVQNITLGYTFDQPWTKKLGLKKARVYAAVQNPFTFTNYLGPDPEAIGEDVYTQLSLYPIITTFGLNITF
jgi:TonB-linked SusC/RagA family outer membrane protein